MAYICLEGLLSAGVNIVGVMGAKPNHNTFSSFKSYVESKNLNYIDWTDLKDEKFIQTIKDLDIDAAVVCSFNYKIPKVLLDCAKEGFINIHPSLLPKYRGGNPYSNVILNGEKETGITIHFMDEDFDTGDIIVQKTVPLLDFETMGTLFNRLNFMGMELLLNVLKEFESKTLPRKKQEKGEFVFGKGIKDDDLLINYTDTAEEIERFIRALNPFLFASTTFRGNLMKVFSAYFVEEDASAYPIGSIAKIKDNNVYIATSKGFILPKAMQFGSFFAGSSADFIRILSPKVGEEFK